MDVASAALFTKSELRVHLLSDSREEMHIWIRELRRRGGASELIVAGR